MAMKFRRREGFRSSEYLAFVSGKPCIVHGSPGEAHHYGDMTDGRGTGHKASDQKLVPVCHACHREVEKLGRKKFESRYGVDFDAVSQRLHELFDERKCNGFAR